MTEEERTQMEALEDELLAQIQHHEKLLHWWQAERQRALKAEAERDQARKWAAAWKEAAKHDRGLLRAAMRFIDIVSSFDAPRRDSEGVWHDPPHKRT